MLKSTYYYTVYVLGIQGTVDNGKKQLLEKGIPMADFTTGRAEFSMIRECRIRDLEQFMPAERREKYMKNPDGPAFAAALTICQGRKHQVKRMLEAIGCRIFYLRRESIGGLALDPSLNEGEYRQLTADEVELLCCHDTENEEAE